MDLKNLILLFSILTLTIAYSNKDLEVSLESKPIRKSLIIQSPGIRTTNPKKYKTEDKKKHFETSHKIPLSLVFSLNQDENEGQDIIPYKLVGRKFQKRQAAESPAPAPPGAIKLNVAQLLERYKQVVKTSTTPPSTTKAASTVATSKRRATRRRTRRTASLEPTSPKPVLTTSRIVAKNLDFDVIGAASDKQRSRIQIKKGPNGQDYEYEYVYYYYDDDDPKDSKPITNAHDGPARNTISRSDKATPEVNEVVPSKNKSRSRQLGEEEVQEERLPANTRFPPRSRNLNTTPVSETDPKPAASRLRSRGRPESQAITEVDSVSDETQANRGRTRANVRRPSLELVDSETFNTHSAIASQSPSFPAQLPAGPDELADRPQINKETAEESEYTSKPVQDDDSITTTTTGMNKAALDLYAISQGTQKLFGDNDAELSGTEEDKLDATTQISTDETETTPTTTSSTTTTTAAPTTTTTRSTTTTTTTEASTKASRFGGRRTALSNRKFSGTTTSTTETPSEKPKKFGRPSFGGRSRSKATTASPVEEEVNKEESKSVSQSKPGRARFGSGRPRSRTTTAPETKEEPTSTSSAPSTNNHRPSLPRSRPSFNSLRGRSRSSTAAPTDSTDSEASPSDLSSTTTARPSRRIPGASANIKPLRPGPRINIGGRRGSSSTTTTTETSNTESERSAKEEEIHAEAASEKEEAPAPAPVDNSPLGRLRNKNRLNIQAKPKAAASAASANSPVQVRRINPLLNRRKLGQTTEAPSSEAPSSESTEVEDEVPVEETEPVTTTTTTTEEPRGLNKLLAGRRRLGTRTPGTINHK